MSIQFNWQVMTKDGDGVLSVDGGRADVLLYTGAGTEVDLINDTPYATMADDANNGVYACEVSKTDIYTIAVGGVIVTGDAGIRIDADPPRVINLEAGEVLEIKVAGKTYCTIGRGVDTNIGYVKLPNTSGEDVFIYPNSEGNAVLADTTTP
ncbi:MAG TPA: hypothetical protein PLP19_05660 [bacterium]|nr:hypothetical protein [bacterium]HPN42953.1 hypothetical protein [bacterium]